MSRFLSIEANLVCVGSIRLWTPNPDNPFMWKAILPGPEGCVYEGGRFEAEIILPADYPYAAHESFENCISNANR
jgi:ubiquitin-conjugating enzyme E2 D/E